jgi:uncharacterized protein (DUF305 family)
MRITNRHVVLPVIAALAAAVVTACGGDSGEQAGPAAPAPPTSSASAANTSFNEADVAFAQAMIPHHEQAVEMAKMASEKGSDPKVKELAAKIRSAQDPEIATMKGWLSTWGKPLPTSSAGHAEHEACPG